MSPQPVGADLPPQVHGRKATWFELFFDLVFVVAVAQLSGAYAHHFDWTGAAGSALLLLAMWWCWLGHTFMPPASTSSGATSGCWGWCRSSR